MLFCGDWKVWVHETDFRRNVEVAIVRGEDPNHQEILRFRGPTEVSFDKLEQLGVTADPSFTLDQRLMFKLYEALDQHYRRQGRPPTSESEIKGRLDATERHLEDMRRIALFPYEPRLTPDPK